jgi:Zn-dependent protease
MSIFFWLIAFAVAISVHEAAHAWMADRLGDPTARLGGRLSLNPLVHYDPIGTTLLFGLVIMRALGFPVIPFGWAKPVRIDPFNFRDPRRDAALVSCAGPAANLILAGLLSLILRLSFFPFSPFNWLNPILIPIVFLNVVLAVFNLIPVHPLDGGKILVGLLPEKQARETELFLNQYGVLFLFFLIFPTIRGVSLIGLIISPIINYLISLLIPGSQTI